MKVYVAELDDAVAGFVFTLFDAKRKTGEIGLNAVDPRLQGQGIGRAMYEFARTSRNAAPRLLMSEPAGIPRTNRRPAPMKLSASTRRSPAHLFKVL
ncbi:MAG: GNAT family N-acetyltransferase [Methyloceanibacter sp.]|nr:GNAT family N-acetyltransferase [Methyloceanibacter sp.]